MKYWQRRSTHGKGLSSRESCISSKCEVQRSTYWLLINQPVCSFLGSVFVSCRAVDWQQTASMNKITMELQNNKAFKCSSQMCRIRNNFTAYFHSMRFLYSTSTSLTCTLIYSIHCCMLFQANVLVVKKYAVYKRSTCFVLIKKFLEVWHVDVIALLKPNVFLLLIDFSIYCTW